MIEPKFRALLLALLEHGQQASIDFKDRHGGDCTLGRNPPAEWLRFFAYCPSGSSNSFETAMDAVMWLESMASF